MANVKPFKAIRPSSALAAQVAALPYDVYNREEAAEKVKGHPLSFLNIDRPETQFDPSMDMYADCVYEKAKEMLDREIAEGIFVQDEAVISIGAKGLAITSWFYFFLGMIYVARSVLNGAGDAVYAMINGLMEVAGRVGFAVPLTMIPFIGMWGVFLTTGLTWMLTGLVSMHRYKRGGWAKRVMV